jgi:hypothetical protein
MGGMHRVRWFNAAFVLLLPHQLGHFLGDSSLARLPRRGVLGWWSRGRCGLSPSHLISHQSQDGIGRGGGGKWYGAGRSMTLLPSIPL